MCRDIVCCTLVCLLTLDTMLSHGAPLSSDNDNKLSIYLNEVADQLKQESPVHRQKRHAAVVTDDKEAAALAAITEAEKFEAEMSTETHNRRKRSAAFFLHAAMKLCEGHPTICRSVELSDHGIKVSIKISDE